MDMPIIETSAMSMLVKIVGAEKAREITSQLGGEAMYITRRLRDGRDDRIKQEFRELLSHGGTCMSSYRQLAKRHELTPRRIMAIIREC